MRLILSLIMSFMAALVVINNAYAVEPGSDSYWGGRERGWFWYEKTPVEEDKPKGQEPETPPPVAEKPKRIEDMKNAAEIRAEIQRLMDIAAANPTKENVKAYMDANKYTLDQAMVFTNVYSEVLRENPALDSTIKNPVNALALNTKKQQDAIDHSQKVGQLASTHGLFFFFRGDCPYCHAFAPTLNAFAKQFGMEVFPISLDGGALPEYPRPTVDTYKADLLGVTTVPAVFIGDKASGEVKPVGYGVMALNELIERIYQISTAPKN